MAGIDQRPQQNVYMVGHNDKRTKLIMSELHAAVNRVAHQLGNGLLPEKDRAGWRPGLMGGQSTRRPGPPRRCGAWGTEMRAGCHTSAM
jgi:hypothetical protein